MTAPRVLLAEDDDAMRALIADVLRHDGYEVLEVANGRDLFWCMERAERGQPIDVVVSDIRMPAYDGLDVVEAWAQIGSDVSVVLMSAFPDPEVRRRADLLGVVLLEKPFPFDRLQRYVRQLSTRPRVNSDES
jgi:CheY-like chemotaxis protein